MRAFQHRGVIGGRCSFPGRRAELWIALKKSLPILAAALFVTSALGSLGLPATAEAASSSARVQATGTGTIVVQGQLVVFGLVTGTSRITVVDRRGDGHVTMNGRTRMRSLKGQRRKKRRILIRKAEGRFYVRGSRISVVVRSPSLNVAIAGKGKLRMKGVGRYTLNGSRARNWSRDPRRWRVVRLRPPKRR
jgi:hypothetical protein